MADSLAFDKYQDETICPPDNCPSAHDDNDHMNQSPLIHAENRGSGVHEEESKSDKENENLRGDATFDHESNDAPISHYKSEQRIQMENGEGGCHENEMRTEVESQECNNNNNNDNNNIIKDTIFTDRSENSYSDANRILHNNVDNHQRAYGTIRESDEEKHILDVKHLNDSGIDITDIETERIMENHLHNSATYDNNEIIYDETAPKRIHRPSKLKIHVPDEGSKLLMDGIDKLISPNDKGTAKSPTRMRRAGSVDIPRYKTPSKGRPIIVYNEPEEYVDSQASREQYIHDYDSQHHSEPPLQRLEDDPDRLHVDHIQPHDHYKKSPDTIRKFYSHTLEPTKRCESPVLRMKNRSESSPSTYKKYGRKISSDARLGGGASDSHSNRQPIRKISSHARLEHVMESVNMPKEEPKCRRVSFGAATYIGCASKPGHKFTTDTVLEQLKDNRHELTEVHKIENSKRNIDNKLELRNGDLRMQAKPHKFFIEQQNENSTCISNEDNTVNSQNHSINQTTAGYDNKAYNVDENTHHLSPSMKVIDSQTGTHMNVKKNLHSTIKESSSSESLISFEATKSLDQSHREKKLSTHSLPCVSNHELTKKKPRYSVGVTDSPKSILKVRNDDSVSTGSFESINGKRYKVKRDSVALYHEQQCPGDDDVEKQYHGSWVGISRKDFKRLWDSRYDLLARYKVHLVVFIIFVITLIFVIVGVKLHKPKRAEDSAQDTVIFDPDFRRIHLFDDEELDAVTGILGMEIPVKVPATNCYLNFEDESEIKCLSWEEYAELTIVHKEYNKTQCYDIRWILNPGVRLTDCYDTTGAYWYGPANSSDESQWPLKSTPFSYDSLVSPTKGTFSTVLEYLWLSSNGVAIIIDPDFPVYVSWNEKSGDTFCVSRSYKESSYPDVLNTNRQVQYSICNGVSILETYKFVRNNFFPKLTHLPDFSLLSSPHWSSEAASFSMNDTVVMDLAKQIQDYKLICSTIEIDGKWEGKYGDIGFDKSVFINIDSMITYLTHVGCEITVKVYPYVNYLSENFKDGLVHGYFVKSAGGNAPALLQWEHGVGAMVDVTGPASRDWFKSKLRTLRTSYNVTTIRFGYGNSSWLPSNGDFYTKNLLPNDILKIFSRFVESFGKMILERTSQTQNVPSLISVQSGIIENDNHKCLKNIIPELLSIGMLGYPFLISDGLDLQYITDEKNGELPSRDLFIRWMQLSSFFPAMKYTVKPWQYGDDVIRMSKNLTSFHQDTVIDLIHSMKRSILSGEPILRPMWWADPKDETAFTINDQFLLGDDMIVAPVLCEGKSGVAERKVYFPKGIWRDSLSKALIPGPKWIQYYKVNQDQMAIFTREILFEHA